MKLFKIKNKRYIWIAVLSLLLLTTLVINIITDDRKIINICIGAETILLILIIKSAWNIYSSMIKDFFKKYYNIIKEKLSQYTRMLIVKIKTIFERHNTIKGHDTRSFIFDKNILDNIKNKLGIKQKLRLEADAANTEKIRYYYIKFILKLIEGNYNYKKTSTPKEIKKEVQKNKPASGVLFDVYENVRYSESPFVDDEVAEICDKIE